MDYAAADRQRSTSSGGESSGVRGVNAGYLNNGKDGVLQRNAACHQCRKKKLKCDGQKPQCSACLRSRRMVDDSLACTWDQVKIPRRALQAMRRAEKEQREEHADDSKKRRRVDDLEGRLAQVEAAISRNEPPASADDLFSGNSLSSSSDPRFHNYNPAVRDMQWANTTPSFPGNNAIQSSYPSSRAAYFMETGGGVGPLSPEQTSAFDYLQSAPTNPEPFPEPVVEDEWMQLIWPGWSSFLPAPHVVEHFVTVFFDRVPTYPKMIHRATFFQRLALPPTHPKFPPNVLLHAMIAAASRYTSSDALSSAGTHIFSIPKLPRRPNAFDLSQAPYTTDSTTTPGSTTGSTAPSSESLRSGAAAADCPYAPYHWVSPLEHREFADWHYARAADGIRTNIARGRELMATVQAQILLTMSHFYNAAWVQSWMESSATLRLCPPLGLNESDHTGPDGAPNESLLCAPANLVEREERIRTFWIAFMIERMVGVSSSFPSSLAEDDITVELPLAQYIFDAATERIVTGPDATQSLHEGNFYTEHPPEHADSLNLLIKVTRLASTASTFRRQYARQRVKSGDYANHPLVRLMLQQVAAFRLSFPAHLRKPPKGMLADTDLLTATMMCHAVTIMIGESYIDHETWQSDLANRTLLALRSVLSMIYDVIGTSYDVSYLNSVCACVWLTAARVTLRFHVAARIANDQESMNVFMSEVEVYRLACQSFGDRSSLGLRHAAMISEMISTAKNATPEHFLRSTGKCIRRPTSDANLTMINDDSNPNSTSTSPTGGWPKQYSQSEVPPLPPSGSGPSIDLGPLSFSVGDVDTSFSSSRIL